MGMNRGTPGKADWRDMASAMRHQHKPRDRREFIAAARELRGRGLKLDDIAYTLNLTRVGVIELLRERLPGDPRVKL